MSDGMLGSHRSTGPRSVTDERIEAALNESGVIPELVGWYGNPDHRITARIEVHIGRYVEFDLWPWMGHDNLVDAFRSASERLREQTA